MIQLTVRSHDTPNGILLPHDIPLEETYNGKQFSDFLDHEHLLTICLQNGNACEYLDLPVDSALF